MSSSTDRMFGLINDMLDFARLKSGAGIAAKLEDVDLGPALEQVLEELRTAHLGRTIESRLSLLPKVRCDSARIAQVVSNLLANPLSHGASDHPVRVEANGSGDEVTISVTNKGDPIPEEVQGRLLQPFFRGQTGNSHGLGLGLFISCEIVRSHGGELQVASGIDDTKFSFSIPVEPAGISPDQ